MYRILPAIVFIAFLAFLVWIGYRVVSRSREKTKLLSKYKKIAQSQNQTLVQIQDVLNAYSNPEDIYVLKDSISNKLSDHNKHNSNNYKIGGSIE